MSRGQEARALIINGTVGVGKTSVANAVGDLLRQAQVHNAVIDVDGLRQAWPAPPGDRFNVGLAMRNLTAVTDNYVRAGMTRFVLASVLETETDRRDHEAALGMPVTVGRLVADPSLVHERLHRRHEHDADGLAWHLARSPELATILDAARVYDFCVDVTTLSVVEAASSVLGEAGPGFAPCR